MPLLNVKLFDNIELITFLIQNIFLLPALLVLVIACWPVPTCGSHSLVHYNFIELL